VCAEYYCRGLRRTDSATTTIVRDVGGYRRCDYLFNFLASPYPPETGRKSATGTNTILWPTEKANWLPFHIWKSATGPPAKPRGNEATFHSLICIWGDHFSRAPHEDVAIISEASLAKPLNARPLSQSGDPIAARDLKFAALRLGHWLTTVVRPNTGQRFRRR
jgi:hypothetical protein